MMNTIKKIPVLAAAFYFILTWTAFPVTALLISLVKGITFAEAASKPYLIGVFAVGSVISAFQMYRNTQILAG